jgi:hypothetical protein
VVDLVKESSNETKERIVAETDRESKKKGKVKFEP